MDIHGGKFPNKFSIQKPLRDDATTPNNDVAKAPQEDSKGRRYVKENGVSRKQQ